MSVFPFDRKLLFFIILPIFFTPVYAENYSIANYKIEISLTPSGLTSEKIQLEIMNSGNDLNNIAYSSLTLPENIRVYDENGNLPFNLTKNEENNIVIWKNIPGNSKAKINIEFDTKGLVEQAQNKYIFSFHYIPLVQTENFEMDLTLPQGFILSSIAQSVSPDPSKMSTDGKNIILTWNYEKLDKEFAAIVVYERGFTKESPNYFIYGLFAVIAIVLASVALFYRKEKIDVAMMTLSEEEKMIVDRILKNKEVMQKKLVQETGFSKVKISKLVRRLEEKGIVEKIPWMKTNKLMLSKKVKR